MSVRTASVSALALVLAAICAATAAHADSAYHPYYDTRDSIMYSDTQVPQADGAPAVAVVPSPGQPSPYQAPRDTVAGGGVMGVPGNWDNYPALFHYNNAVTVSGGASFYNFKESAPLTSSVRGWLPSVAGSASYMNHYNTFFAVDASASFGDDTYYGNSRTAPFAPVQLSNSNTAYTVDGKLGQGFYVAPNLMLIPYADVGYRHTKFDNGNANIAYLRNYSIMGGLMVEANPVPRLFLTGYGAGGTTLGSHADNNTTGDSYSLGDSGIYDVGGKAGFMLAPRVEVFSTLDYVHFDYGHSSTVADNTSFPGGRTNDTTVRVGLGYHFR